MAPMTKPSTASSRVIADVRPDRALRGALGEPGRPASARSRRAWSRRTGRSSRCAASLPRGRATATTISDPDAGDDSPVRRTPRSAGAVSSSAAEAVDAVTAVSACLVSSDTGRLLSLGRSRPLRAGSPRSRGRSRGTRASAGSPRPRAGAAGRSSTTSLTVAGPAVITTTRSASAIASSRSWVTNTTAAPVPAHSSQQLVLHQLAGLHVERAEGLVHQQDLGLVDQRLGHRDALAHAAGELVRVAVLEAGQPDPVDPVAAPCASASRLRRPR